MSMKHWKRPTAEHRPIFCFNSTTGTKSWVETLPLNPGLVQNITCGSSRGLLSLLNRCMLLFWVRGVHEEIIVRRCIFGKASKVEADERSDASEGTQKALSQCSTRSTQASKQEGWT